jgi:hypothetical protein
MHSDNMEKETTKIAFGGWINLCHEASVLPPQSNQSDSSRLQIQWHNWLCFDISHLYMGDLD